MPPDRTRQATRPVTYFIQAVHGGPVKIGYSTEAGLSKRLGDIQVGCPDVLHIAGKVRGQHEARFHRQWSAHRLCGEWFSPVEAMKGHAPGLIVGDDRTDIVRACQTAYERGRHDGLMQAAEELPDYVAERLKADLCDLAGEEIPSPILKKMFAPRSHVELLDLGEEAKSA